MNREQKLNCIAAAATAWSDYDPQAIVDLAALERACDAFVSAGAVIKGWQPIETAPKDGTRFIGGNYRVRISAPNYFEWYICVYAKECTIPTEDEGFGIEGNDGEFYCPEGFYKETANNYGDDFYNAAKPTHWMAVPALTQIEAESSDSAKSNDEVTK